MKKILFLIVFLILVFYSNQTIVAEDNFASPASPGTVSLTNPLGKDITPQIIIGKIINAVLGLVGSLALLMFIYGGLVWMTAAGASDKVQKGKDILVWAAIGMVVIFSSYAITRFVLDALAGK